MSVSLPTRRRPRSLPVLLVASAAVGLAACSDNSSGPVEQPQVQLSNDYESLGEALAQWWSQPGVERSFRFRVQNQGAAVRDVPFTLWIGPNLSLLSVQCLQAGQPCAGTAIGSTVFKLDSISKGDDIRVIVRVAEQSAQSTQAMTMLSAVIPGDTVAPNKSTLNERTVWLADRSVALNAPTSAAAGGTVDVDLTIANRGPDFFYETRSLTLPAGVVAEQLACTMTDGAGCTTATLDHSDVGVRASQAAVLRYRLSVPADFRGPLTISKMVRSDGDTNPADNATSATIQVSAPGSS